MNIGRQFDESFELSGPGKSDDEELLLLGLPMHSSLWSPAIKIETCIRKIGL
jgi:hypothetical protein